MMLIAKVKFCFAVLRKQVDTKYFVQWSSQPLGILRLSSSKYKHLNEHGAPALPLTYI